MTPDQLAAARRGRPRDVTRDQELMTAALDLVAEVGYDRVSMEAVATACSASKATIYRRWPSKAALVAAALSCREKHPHNAVAFSGDLRQDMIDGLVQMAQSIQEDDLNLMVGLLGAMRSDPELASELRSQMVLEKRAAARAWTCEGIAAGQLLPGTDLSLVQDIGPAQIFSRLLVTGDPVDDAFCTRLVDEVLLPLVESHTPPDPERTSS
jgi:AcrR family transcriptional regulator